MIGVVATIGQFLALKWQSVPNQIFIHNKECCLCGGPSRDSFITSWCQRVKQSMPTPTATNYSVLSQNTKTSASTWE
jgi:hypothetical protein